MANLTEPRDTPRLGSGTLRLVEAGGTINAGGIVALKAADGKGYPAPASAEYIPLGIACDTVSSGGKVLVERGIFLLDGDTGSGAITSKAIGGVCYVVDDHTVSVTSGAAVAGKVYNVDSAGAWIEIL